MGELSRLRDAADFLLNQEMYDTAFDIYDEIYCQIWSALGSAQSGLTQFSYGFLSHSLRPAVEFKNSFILPAVNSTFLKWFNMDMDQTQNEFIFTTYGHLHCIVNSQKLIDKIPPAMIFNEFLLLYSLIIHSADNKWLNSILRIFTPVIHDNRLKKIRMNLTDVAMQQMLLQSSELIKETDWNFLNSSLLDFMQKTGERNSELYQSIRKNAGYSSDENRKRKTHKDHSKHNSNDNRREQEHDSKEDSRHKREHSENQGQKDKYSSYDKNSTRDKHNSSSRKNGQNGNTDFEARNATDEEKARHYGKILGLEGKVTKSEIRKRYLEVIARYHPDKVQGLGEEIMEIAEQKTKEINAAYEWLKLKFNL